ncbi:MAG: pentapeptide repeat-containing protein [Bacteroidetes bacterium]|nr:pentapeptide repeat-containing protein [Bacteroidota bacterium]
MDFSECTFVGSETRFVDCTFKKGASFLGSRFEAEKTTFSRCTFEAETKFNHAVFKNATIFEGSRDSSTNLLFKGHVQFKYISIREPKEFTFRYVNFENVEFRGTDLQDLRVTSVNWRKAKTSIAGRERIILYDQVLLEQQQRSNQNLKIDEHEFNLVQNAYRDLKQNFDNNRFFGPADEFYFREMEMLRLHPRNLVTRCFSWRALYRLTSGYGLFWLNGILSLLFTVLIFAALTLLTGFEKPQINYDLAFSFPTVSKLWSDYLDALTYNLLSVFPAKDISAVYLPSICTRIVQIPEYALIATFSTLTILAIRRRFKR